MIICTQADAAQVQYFDATLVGTPTRGSRTSARSDNPFSFRKRFNKPQGDAIRRPALADRMGFLASAALRFAERRIHWANATFFPSGWPLRRAACCNRPMGTRAGNNLCRLQFCAFASPRFFLGIGV
jgi:hypothetical protein